MKIRLFCIIQSILIITISILGNGSADDFTDGVLEMPVNVEKL